MCFMIVDNAFPSNHLKRPPKMAWETCPNLPNHSNIHPKAPQKLFKKMLRGVVRSIRNSKFASSHCFSHLFQGSMKSDLDKLTLKL